MAEVDADVASVEGTLDAGTGADVGSVLLSNGPFVLEGGGLGAEVGAEVVDGGGSLCFDEIGERVFEVSLVGEVVDVSP
jgi:hypothetical protein